MSFCRLMKGTTPKTTTIVKMVTTTTAINQRMFYFMSVHSKVTLDTNYSKNCSEQHPHQHQQRTLQHDGQLVSSWFLHTGVHRVSCEDVVHLLQSIFLQHTFATFSPIRKWQHSPSPGNDNIHPHQEMTTFTPTRKWQHSPPGNDNTTRKRKCPQPPTDQAGNCFTKYCLFTYISKVSIIQQGVNSAGRNNDN